MSRLLKILIVIGGLGLATTVGAGVWANGQMNPGGSGAEVIVTIPTGASTQRIASILEQRKIITNATLFRFYARVRGASSFEAGDYKFHVHESFGAVISALKKGPGSTFDRLTIPEGFTLKQIAERVGTMPGRSADKFLAAAASGSIRSKYEPPEVNNLEGLVFPDTYFVDVKDTEATILQRMVSEFDSVAGSLGYDNGAAGGVTPYHAIVVASLVESEGKVEVDRPKIAQVIYNRLNKSMPLQIDATVIYARGGTHRENGQVLNSDLLVDSPYNTYKVRGLPPTPIAAAGRASLKVALAPEAGPWLYYVKFQTDGTHAFAVTLDEQNRNIADAKRRGVIPR